MNIPFVKAHGAGNDFLFTFEKSLPQKVEADRLPVLAKAICERHVGVGADGWYLIRQPIEGHHAEILLFNSDGSKAELSGNGTRCAAAILLDAGLPTSSVRILTGAGPRQLKSLGRDGQTFRFEMDMGRPLWKDAELRFSLVLASGSRDVAIVDVGNPQCAVFVENFQFDWHAAGAEIEKHKHFLNGTNVSFVRKVDDHSVEARFWERGAGATLSSGTGSLGAAVTAILLGLAGSPVRVLTEAGELEITWGPPSRPAPPCRIETPVSPPAAGSGSPEGDPVAEASGDPALPATPAPEPVVTWAYIAPEGPALLAGPAQITTRGEFYW
jgi:diaminopimelate epimerase